MNKTESEATLKRLSHYARCLRMAIANGIDIITSSSIAEPCGISPASVRKDLAAYGEFGKQGSGYNPEELLGVIEEILGIVSPPPVVLLGTGRLGRALLEGGIPGTKYRFFAAFDIDNSRTGELIGGITVSPSSQMRMVLNEITDFIGMICVTPGEAQHAVDLLVKNGCRAILSFNVEPLHAPPGVDIRYTDMPFEMDLLSHGLKNEGRCK